MVKQTTLNYWRDKAMAEKRKIKDPALLSMHKHAFTLGEEMPNRLFFGKGARFSNDTQESLKKKLGKSLKINKRQ